jgi:uncharacterized protein DUF6788
MISADMLRSRIREKLREQRALTLDLLRLREQLGGSLFARYGECGKEACACRQGQKHGPYWVLSTRSAGRGGFTYLDARAAGEARTLVERYRAFKAGLRRLRRLNADIVTLLRRYQSAMSRQSGRRLGVSLNA